MSILTQRIEIYEDSNPLETRFVDIPVHKGEKILSHEPYAKDMLKAYSHYCSDDVMSAISEYENAREMRDIREGYVLSYNEEKSTAEICLSKKHAVSVDINPNESIKIGDKIDVVVTKTKGRLTGDASSKAAKLERLKQELIKQIQTPTSAYSGVVKEAVLNANGVFNGFNVDINGIECFMPGVESDVVPLNDYNDLIGEVLYVMPVNKVRESIIVSHREYLNTLKPAVFSELASYEKSTVVTGVISSVKKFGVFILIKECVPTLLSVSEMNEITESKFKNGGLKIGDPIDFYIDNIDINDYRITVTQNVSKTEGWDKLKEVADKTENYVLKGTVKNLFDNGVVVTSSEFNDITFFLSSRVIEIDKLTVGSEINIPVESVDTSKKIVRMKIETNE